MNELLPFGSLFDFYYLSYRSVSLLIALYLSFATNAVAKIVRDIYRLLFPVTRIRLIYYSIMVESIRNSFNRKILFYFILFK